MGQRVHVVGVGMVPFATPSKSRPYDELGEDAIRAALNDAGLDYSLIQQVYVGYVYGDSTCGQKVVYRVGIISYEALGLTPEGTAEKFIADGDNTYGGRVVTNPSGGLLSKGHPLGATGLAQCAELTWQLRGQAGPRQVDDVTVALQHNIGLGGAAVVTMYEKVD
ncbi:hypothetical protein [Yimella sp. cx-51]|uniref:thiolase C-terminal domain-containing protein n=1 Tax=Yimella sp. cx-51 TaxID=2770551 RepID=UPI00165D539B|nr:hypothetical protein [Yimella sp. cx-51]MBC9956300.1 hypothetical protein [Yimella sp. cx-51]QTH38563.1 hypothetical protein J5M86_02550 [Yimella sp. cx-51]